MEIGRYQGMIANDHIKIGSNSYEKVNTFKYLGSLLTNQNSIQEEIHVIIQSKHSCLLDFSLIKSVAYSSQGSHTGQLDFCN